jgi:hypothetical protein
MASRYEPGGDQCLQAGGEEPRFARFEGLTAALGLRPDIVLAPLAEHEAEPGRRELERSKKFRDSRRSA